MTAFCVSVYCRRFAPTTWRRDSVLALSLRPVFLYSGQVFSLVVRVCEQLWAGCHNFGKLAYNVGRHDACCSAHTLVTLT